MLYTCTRGEKTALPKKEVQKMAVQEVQSTRIAIVKVPVIFWDDHFGRDLDFTSVEVSRNKLTVTLRMTDEALAELISDSDYYANYMQDFEQSDSFGRSVVSSARSTIKALYRQGFINYGYGSDTSKLELRKEAR
jgi:hypothetical protein